MTSARGGRPTDGRFRAAALIVVAAVVLLIAYPLRYVLIPFAVAGGMAFATSPAVEWLQRRLRFPHIAAVLAVFAPNIGRGRRPGVLDWYIAGSPGSGIGRQRPDSARPIAPRSDERQPRAGRRHGSPGLAATERKRGAVRQRGRSRRGGVRPGDGRRSDDRSLLLLSLRRPTIGSRDVVACPARPSRSCSQGRTARSPDVEEIRHWIGRRGGLYRSDLVGMAVAGHARTARRTAGADDGHTGTDSGDRPHWVGGGSERGRSTGAASPR